MQNTSVLWKYTLFSWMNIQFYTGVCEYSVCLKWFKDRIGLWNLSLVICLAFNRLPRSFKQWRSFTQGLHLSESKEQKNSDTKPHLHSLELWSLHSTQNLGIWSWFVSSLKSYFHLGSSLITFFCLFVYRNNHIRACNKFHFWFYLIFSSLHNFLPLPENTKTKKTFKCLLLYD